MRRITYPQRAGSRTRASRAAKLVFLLGVLLFATGANSSTRPRTGGTLRVQMSARVISLDPRQWPADSVQSAAVEKLAGLAFDRLTRLDAQGTVQPALATSWSI